MSSEQDTLTREQPEILARGPWELERVRTCWLQDQFVPTAAHTAMLGLGFGVLHIIFGFLIGRLSHGD